MTKTRAHLYAALACSIGLAYCSHARADTLGIDAYSVHVPARHDQTDLNPGLYYRLDNGLGGGAYRNTLHRASAWAGYSLGVGPFALTLGAVTGYGRPVLPLIAPSVAFGPLRLVLVPRCSATRSTVLHLAFEVAL